MKYSLKNVSFLISILIAAWGVPSNVEGFYNLGETYTVPAGSTFNSAGNDYLVGNLNVDGTYNNTNGIYYNNIDISGTLNNNGSISGALGWYGYDHNITVTPTGNYNQSGGYLWHYVDSFLNQGTTEITGGSVNGITLFQNEGTFNLYNGYFFAPTIINDGNINLRNNIQYLGDIINLDISSGVITDITGVSGLIQTYDSSRIANLYLENKDYLLSGGGLFTKFSDVVAVTPDQDYYFTKTYKEAWNIEFDYWWDMGIQPPPYQSGYNFDVLALQGGEGWQYIGQIDAYGSSTGWNTATFLLPESFSGSDTQIRFVLNDYYPETDPAVYIRAVKTPEPSTMLLLGSGLAGLVGYGKRRMKK